MTVVFRFGRHLVQRNCYQLLIFVIVVWHTSSKNKAVALHNTWSRCVACCKMLSLSVLVPWGASTAGPKRVQKGSEVSRPAACWVCCAGTVIGLQTKGTGEGGH